MTVIQCSRCGASNHGDARYCGTCGDALPVLGGIAALVADDPTPVENGSAVEPLGVDDDASTHRVDPPAFGETGPAVTSALTSRSPEPTAVVTPPDDATFAVARATAPLENPSAAAPLAASSRSSSRSTSIMLAAVAIAAVVIAGGVIVLLVGGSGADETTAIDEASTEIVEPVTTEVVETTAVVPAETSPDDGSTDASAPQTTASSASEATTPPVVDTTSPPSTRGPGDLGLTQPILDEACDGRYITFVGSAVGDRPYSVVVGELLDLYPGANYVWTKACPSLRQEFSDGADIYGVVFGPYATQQEACDARAFGPEDAYVRRISTTDPEDHTVSC